MTDQPEQSAARHGVLGKYAYGWLTLGFFLGALLLHWFFGWRSYLSDAEAHGQPAIVADYLDMMLRDTFENWQSEFLQLLWQVVGLAYFLYVGSPSSKENDDRMEAKIDLLLRLQPGKDIETRLADIDKRYLRHGGSAKPHG